MNSVNKTMKVFQVLSEPFQKEGQEDWFITCEVMVEGDDDFTTENIKFPGGIEQCKAFVQFVEGLEEQIEQHVMRLSTEIEHFSEMLENRPYVILTEDDGTDEEDDEYERPAAVH